jgi:hypothetical protein
MTCHPRTTAVGRSSTYYSQGSAAQSCFAVGGTSSAEPPAPFLKMIVVHELAHLKQRANDKAFYGFWTHVVPTYHQLELDLRLWLTAFELPSSVGHSGQRP